MENEIIQNTLHDIQERLTALEKAVASLTEKNKGASSDEPCGQFAHLGGIERRPARSVEPSEEPIDFSSIGGVLIRPEPEESVELEELGE